MGSDSKVLVRRGSRLVESSDFVDLLARLDGLDRWLAANGVQRGGGDRLSAYLRHVRALAKANLAGAPVLDSFWKKTGPEKLCNSLVEATEWADIFDTFGTAHDRAIAERLRDCVKGPVLYRDEVSDAASNRARNIQAELAIAARMARHGVSAIDLGSGGDFSFPFLGRVIYVQAKRLASARRVRRRVGEAKEQLARDYTRGLACAGLVAISITKLVNPAGDRPHVRNWDELDALLRNVSAEFAAQHEHLWHGGDDRTLGALIHFRCGAYVEEAPWFAPAECLTFAARADLKAEGSALAQRLRWLFEGRGLVLPGLPQPGPKRGAPLTALPSVRSS